EPDFLPGPTPVDYPTEDSRGLALELLGEVAVLLVVGYGDDKRDQQHPPPDRVVRAPHLGFMIGAKHKFMCRVECPFIFSHPSRGDPFVTREFLDADLIEPGPRAGLDANSKPLAVERCHFGQVALALGGGKEMPGGLVPERAEDMEDRAEI